MTRLATPLGLATMALAAAVAAVAVATPAAACSCAIPPPLAQVIASTVYTVKAKVTETVFIPHPLEQQHLNAEWKAQVQTAYKGCLPRTIRVVSGANSALCGVRLTVGTEYLFTLWGADSDGKYMVGSCSTFKSWPNVTAADRRALMSANRQVCPAPQSGGY